MRRYVPQQTSAVQQICSLLDHLVGDGEQCRQEVRPSASRAPSVLGNRSRPRGCYAITPFAWPQDDRAKRKRLSPNRACNETSVRRLATLRVQRRTPGQRVAKNCHVRRQLRRPHSFPLSQDFGRCCTKQRNRVPKLRRFHAPPLRSAHP